MLVKGRKDHSLKQDKYAFHAQPKTIIHLDAKKTQVEFCAQVDEMPFSPTLVMKQHLSWEVKIAGHPSLERSQGRSKDCTLLGSYTRLKGGRNSPSFLPFCSALLGLKGVCCFHLVCLDFLF